MGPAMGASWQSHPERQACPRSRPACAAGRDEARRSRSGSRRRRRSRLRSLRARASYRALASCGSIARPSATDCYTPLVAQKITPNDLRRTFASLLVQGGTARADVATLMGHASTAMVFKVYGRDTPESLAKRVHLDVDPTVPNFVPNSVDSVDETDAVESGDPYFSRGFVARAGIEPATRGFSVRCSTN